MNFSFNGAPDQGIGWMEFISSLVGSLAWPVVIGLVFLMFRTPLTALINNIKQASWGDGSITIDRQLEEAEQTGQQVAASIGHIDLEGSNLTPDNPDDPDLRFEQLLDVEPALAILDIWRNIEQAMEEVASQMAITVSGLRPIGVSQLGKQLVKQGLVPSNFAELLDEMRHVRNAAVHAKAVTRLDALRFYELSKTVQPILRKLKLS